MFVALLVATGAALAPPGLAGLATAEIASDDGSLGDLELIVAGFLVTGVMLWGASYLQTYLVGWVGQRVLQDLRMRIFSHLQEMSIGFFTRNRPGVLISRITNDVDALDQLVSTGIVTLLQSSLTLIGVVVILLFLDAGLAAIVFLTFPLLAIASLVFRIVAASAYRITRERIAEVTAYLQESLSGIRVVRTLLPGGAARGADGRAERAQPPGEHEDRLPERLLLPRGGAALGDRDGGDPDLRRPPGTRPERRRPRRADRHRDRVRGLPEHVLRPDPAALEPLHDLPAGNGRAGQDLRPARHRARPRRQAGRDRPAPAPRRDRARPRLVLIWDRRRPTDGR